MRRIVGSLAAAPPSRMRRALVLPSLLACLGLASFADARCHKDCKHLIASTLKTCKRACPPKRPGGECRRQCKGARKEALAACKVAASPAPPTCGLSTSTTGAIPQELVHRWNWTRVTPLGTFNPNTGEPFETTQIVQLELHADGTTLLEIDNRNRLDCCTVTGGNCGGETIVFYPTAAATAERQMLTIASGPGTRQDSNNCNPAGSQTTPLGSVTLTLPWALTTDPFNQRQALELPAGPFDETCTPACPDLLLDQIE